MDMKLALLRIGAGLALIVTVVLTAALTERPRERRHARRPPDVADKLLELARVTAADVVYDLECGDGTLSVIAARKYGARSICVDVVSRRIAEAQARARSDHVEHLVTVTQQD
jgi:predicted RNA methylase